MSIVVISVVFHPMIFVWRTCFEAFLYALSFNGERNVDDIVLLVRNVLLSGNLGDILFGGSSPI